MINNKYTFVKPELDWNYFKNRASDSITIEKAPGDVITLAAGKVSAVGSPRS